MHASRSHLRRRLQTLIVAALGVALGASALALHPGELDRIGTWAKQLQGSVVTPLAEEEEAVEGTEMSTVTLNEVRGPMALSSRFARQLERKLEREALTFTSPGVKAMTVDAAVSDETTESKGGELEVRITASLLMIDRPTDAMRGSLSASAVVTLPADASAEVKRAMKEEAVDALVTSLYEDLARYVAARS